MTLNNAYKIYTVLNERQHQQAENGSDLLKELSMDNAIKELTYSLLQGSCGVQKRAAYHSLPQWDILYAFDCNGGIKQQTE